jgi:hypothetical protein
MSASNFLELKLLDHSLGTASWTSPTDVYLALFSTDPTDAGSGTELSGDGYARKVVTFDAAADGATVNAATVTFDEAEADWDAATHFGIYDAATTGNLLFHGELDTARTATTGQQIRFLQGEIEITAD